jgi:CelD/BcsL family acetyltransferase involved in cellulose biosynthesis
VKVHILDPLVDGRWGEFAARHPSASAFHQPGWLEALRRTYGYTPVVLTTAGTGEPLADGVVLCRVSSWLTGTRWVSLPFADHCEPLVNEAGECLQFVKWLRRECDLQRWKYVELRPLSPLPDAEDGLQPSRSYCFHELDIRENLERIFRGFHKDSIQRKVRRAEKEGLSYEAGRSNQLLDDFFRLVLITRRRHQLLPQPRVWFSNLIACMGDNIQIRVARKAGRAISAMLTLKHGSSAIYKYGCSDERFHSLGGMPFLFWKFIEESKAVGVEKVDFGRSDLENEGLIAFKDKFGASRQTLTYYKYPHRVQTATTMTRGSEAARRLLFLLPDVVSVQAGRFLYRHMG